MVVLNGVIANRMSLTLASFVRSTSSRTMAGEGIEGSMGSIRDLEGRGCLATVGVLGEFGQLDGGLDEYKRAVDALKRRGMDKRLAVRLTELRLTPDEGLDTPSCGRNFARSLL
jgi:proline dehydrogenase